MSRVALLLCALAAGCYDVDALSSDFTGDGGVRRDGSGRIDGGADWEPVASGTRAALRSLWAPAAGEAWIGGAGSTVLHALHGVIAADPSPPGFSLRAATGQSVPVMAGDDGAILHRTAAGWQTRSIGDLTFHSAWAAADADLWIVGTAATIVHATDVDTYIENDARMLNATLHGLYGRSASEVWTAGDFGALLHVVNDAPTTLSSGTTATLRAVFVDAGQVIVVGDGGLVLRSTDGVTFAPEESGTAATLHAVFGAGGTVWAAGDGGVILVRQASWSVEHTGGPALHALGGTGPADLWAAGDDGAVLRRAP